MYDPSGRDPDFNRMVLLGHSMGGLLSHMMAVSSGDELWRLYSDRSFDSEIIGPREVLDELQHYLFFKPLPFVSRVVFMATPHRGSDLSRGMVGRVGTSLIADPDHIHKLLGQLVKDNPDAFDTRRFRRFPTSIETLETNSPMLHGPPEDEARARAWQFHSIIGSIRATGVDQSTDGVVPYRSSHLDGVVSENERWSARTTASSRHPEAIIEVRRILREHWAATQAGQGVQEARGPGATSPVKLEPPTTLR